jgi:hypothetical protein
MYAGVTDRLWKVEALNGSESAETWDSGGPIRNLHEHKDRSNCHLSIVLCRCWDSPCHKP